MTVFCRLRAHERTGDHHVHHRANRAGGATGAGWLGVAKRAGHLHLRLCCVPAAVMQLSCT